MNNQNHIIDPSKPVHIVPGCKLLPLKDLKVGDIFQYHGAELWNTVTRVTEEKVYYLYELQPDSVRVGINWKAFTQIYVWVKEVQS